MTGRPPKQPSSSTFVKHLRCPHPPANAPGGTGSGENAHLSMVRKREGAYALGQSSGGTDAESTG